MDKYEKLGDDEIESIAPDVADAEKLPIDSAKAVRREEEIYGENSTDPNRDDLFDEHHGQPEDIV